ncbi:hypothetical protein NECAME_17100 [Necator americanus]|uniref:Uncharacterized protein n=1 Tax=Necator americanus TaxID=51031 RepID=W2TTY4_NECAM|nr:hypothetical protein NECAME_17100 [Necator americanus]ETN84561.1 hypothetical protein NECAME_17100 [Necator americanus]
MCPELCSGSMLLRILERQVMLPSMRRTSTLPTSSITASRCSTQMVNSYANWVSHLRLRIRSVSMCRRMEMFSSLILMEIIFMWLCLQLMGLSSNHSHITSSGSRAALVFVWLVVVMSSPSASIITHCSSSNHSTFVSRFQCERLIAVRKNHHS